jgi:hypothetical protein
MLRSLALAWLLLLPTPAWALPLAWQPITFGTETYLLTPAHGFDPPWWQLYRPEQVGLPAGLAPFVALATGEVSGDWILWVPLTADRVYIDPVLDAPLAQNPEPGTLRLVAAALAGVGVVATWRRRRGRPCASTDGPARR